MTTAANNKYIESLSSYLIGINNIFSDSYIFNQTIKILLLINRLQNLNDDNKARISWKIWDSHFRNCNYSEIERILVGHKVVISDMKYIAPNIALFHKTESRTFKIGKDVSTLLKNIKKDELKRYQTDKQYRKTIQNTKSFNNKKDIIYNDIAKDSIKYNIDNIKIDVNKVIHTASQFSTEKELFSYQLVLDILKGDYQELINNKSDNRISNILSFLPAELRDCFSIDNKKRVSIIDISNCNLSCFGFYIKSVYDSLNNDEQRRVDLHGVNNNNIKSAVPLCGLKELNDNKKQPAGSIPPLCLGILRKSLDTEIEAWNDIFLNPKLNPKAYLAQMLGLDDLNKVKKICIKYINGCKLYGQYMHRLDEWFKATFPNIYKIWHSTDRKMTGCNIGKQFETKLMLNADLYKHAFSLGIILLYEYDGFSLYADDDKHIPDFISFLENKSVELLGFKLIFKDKYNAFNLGLDANQFALDSLLNSPKYEQYNVKLEKLQSRVDKSRKHMFALRNTLKSKGSDVVYDDYHAVSEASKHYNKCKQVLRLYMDKHKDMINKIEALRSQLN